MVWPFVWKSSCQATGSGDEQWKWKCNPSVSRLQNNLTKILYGVKNYVGIFWTAQYFGVFLTFGID